MELALEQLDLRFGFRANELLIMFLFLPVITDDIDAHCKGNDRIVADDILEEFVNRHFIIPSAFEKLYQLGPFNPDKEYQYNHDKYPKDKLCPFIRDQVPGYYIERNKVRRYDQGRERKENALKETPFVSRHHMHPVGKEL